MIPSPPLKTTIIIPCWNGGSTIRRCLESVSALKRPGELEVIVVDDASTDDTAAAAGVYPCRVVRCERRGGAGRARNRGAELATGDLLFFTDADVVLPADALELAAKAFERERADCVVGVFSAENPYRDFFSQYKSLYCNFKYRALTGGPAFNTAAAVLPKRVFAELNGFNETLAAAEDNDLGDRLFKKGFRCVIEHRLEVVHLKEFNFKGLLLNDFRKSVALSRMFFGHIKRRTLTVHGGFTDISGGLMLNVPLVYLCLGSLAAWFATASPRAALAFAALLAAFGLNNSGFLLFLSRRKGPLFALRSFAFMIVDYAVVGLAVVSGMRSLFTPNSNPVLQEQDGIR